jgi:hypothetical protein
MKIKIDMEPDADHDCLVGLPALEALIRGIRETLTGLGDLRNMVASVDVDWVNYNPGEGTGPSIRFAFKEMCGAQGGHSADFRLFGKGQWMEGSNISSYFLAPRCLPLRLQEHGLKCRRALDARLKSLPFHSSSGV